MVLPTDKEFDAVSRRPFACHVRRKRVSAVPEGISLVLCLLLWTAAGISSPHGAIDMGALVLVNTASADYSDFPQLIEPYLLQFGVPHRVQRELEVQPFEGIASVRWPTNPL
jgi:hypothetical protein